MRITLTIPDDTYDKLTRLTKDVPKYIADRLDTLITIDPQERKLILNKDHIRQLQELAGGTLFSNPDKLVDHIRNTQTVRFEDGCEVVLNTDDLYILQQQAQGMGAASFEDYIREFIQEALSYSLYGTGGRR